MKAPQPKIKWPKECFDENCDDCVNGIKMAPGDTVDVLYLHALSYACEDLWHFQTDLPCWAKIQTLPDHLILHDPFV